MKIEFKNEMESVRIDMYDAVGKYEMVNTDEVKRQLDEAAGKALDVHINSCGGEVFEGFTIYNMLKAYEGYVTVTIDGISASIASVIAMAGNSIKMNKASMMMIHNASGVSWGNAEEMEKVVRALHQIDEVIVGIYRDRTNLDEETIKEMMSKETYLTSDECLAKGFCDEIIDGKEEEEKTEAAADSLKSMFDNRISTLNSLKAVYGAMENQAETSADVESVLEEAETPSAPNAFNKAKRNTKHWLEGGLF